MRRIAVGALTGVLLSVQVPAALAPRPKPTQNNPPPAQIATACTQANGNIASPGNYAWWQHALNFQDAWQFTMGQGETVAVVDSGVSDSGQLGGRLSMGQSLTGTSSGLDCQDHGTGVASIIAAAARPNNPLVGVAPAAHILSIKVTDQDTVDSGTVAQGILDAVNDGARIINVSDQVRDTPALRDAVLAAQRKDAVIVAAAGNDDQPGERGPWFPAAYTADPATFPNILSVGAIQFDGTLPDFADPFTHVSVAAPGKDIVLFAPGGTYQQRDGTSFATPFVSGVAALVRAAHPNLSAAAVVRRIIATADGGTDTGTGAGMVDPVQAVTAVIPGEGQTAPATTPPPPPVSVPGPPPADRFGHILFTSVAGGAIAATVLVVAAAVIIPAGRRRGWRPGRARPAKAEEHADSVEALR